MKPYNLLLVCLCLLFFAQCMKKVGPDRPIMPPVTAEGKNKVGFTLDGKVWLPFHPCAAWNNSSCLEARVAYKGAGELNMSFTRANGSKGSYLEITSQGNGTITGPGEKIDSIAVHFRAENAEVLLGHYVDPQPGSKFVINRMDTVNNIIAGQFELILIEEYGSGKIHLKEGRFDFKLPTCLCRWVLITKCGYYSQFLLKAYTDNQVIAEIIFLNSPFIPVDTCKWPCFFVSLHRNSEKNREKIISGQPTTELL